MQGCSHTAWDNHFYNQYMQHHVQLTQWYEQLQQTIDPNRGAYLCNGSHARPFHRGHTMQHCGVSLPFCNPRGRPATRGPRHCCSAQARPACCAARPWGPSVQRPQQYTREGALLLHNPQNNVPFRYSRHVPCWLPHLQPTPGFPREGPAPRRAVTSQVSVEKQEESEDSTEEEDNSSSEDELICDLDAFVTVIETAEDSDDGSEESFDLMDTAENEKVKNEYVEMDEYGITQKRYGKRREINTLEKEILKKDQREYLYGERADAICGLETVMAINFDHFTDMNQPLLWPVLPLTL